MSIFGAGWASGHIVVPDRVKRRVNVIEDSETSTSHAPHRLGLGLRLSRRKLKWHHLSSYQSS
jgi:hypothetical protein